MRRGVDAEYKERNRFRVQGEKQMQSISKGADALYKGGTDEEYKEGNRCRL